MKTFLLFATAYLIAGLLSGIGIAHLVERKSIPFRRGLYWLLLIASFVPVAAHYRWTVSFSSSWGEPAWNPQGMYQNLRTFVLTAPAAAVITLVMAMVLSVRWPMLTSLAPLLFAAGYHRFLLPSATMSPLGQIPLDNKTHIWLAIFSAAASSLLVGYAYTALQRK